MRKKSSIDAVFGILIYLIFVELWGYLPANICMNFSADLRSIMTTSAQPFDNLFYHNAQDKVYRMPFSESRYLSFPQDFTAI